MLTAEPLIPVFSNNSKGAWQRCSSHSCWCSVCGRETWVFSGFGIKLGDRGCCGSPNVGHQWGPWDSTGGVAEANLSFSKRKAPIRWLLCMSMKIIIYNSGHRWAKCCRRCLFIPPPPSPPFRHCHGYQGGYWEKRRFGKPEWENSHVEVAFMKPQEPLEGINSANLWFGDVSIANWSFKFFSGIFGVMWGTTKIKAPFALCSVDVSSSFRDLLQSTEVGCR